MKRGLAAVLWGFFLLFYMGIIMYVFFAIININAFKNFETAMAFEMIGFLLLIYFVMSNVLSGSIKTGFFVPLLMVTIAYTIILDVLNIAFVIIMPHVFFVLIHFVILFIYSLISIPMYIMGKDKK